MKKRWYGVVITLVAVLTLLLTASPALAFHCEEWVNPHGANVPPAGWSTRPGDNPNSGKNPDGFYRVLIGGNYWADRADTLQLWFTYVGNETNPQALGPIDFQPITGEAPKHSEDPIMEGAQVVFKITEAPGAKPSCKMIGSNNGKGQGKAGAVMVHIKVPADPLWSIYEAGTDNLFQNQAGTVWYENPCCVVPPPPK